MFKGNILGGIGLLAEAFSRLRQPGLRRYVAMPLIINMAVFACFGWMFYSWVESVVNSLLSYVPDWLSWLQYILLPAFVLVFLIAVFFVFNFVANIVAAPFNGLLAEKVCQQENPAIQSCDESVSQMLKRTLGRELQKLMYILPRMLALVIFSWIPVLNLAAPVLWFCFSAWVVALQYVDYAADNQGRTIKEVRAFMAQHRLTSFSLGAMITVVLTIPVLNFIVIPWAVIAASIFWQRNQVVNAAMGSSEVAHS